MANELIFPGGSLPGPREVEFRDGVRMVPEYLADMMHGIETHRLTYEEAVQAANKKAESDHINAQHGEILSAYFRGMR